MASCTSTTSAAPQHEFDYDDVGLLKKSFVEVVRKHYGGREDGTLSDPTFVERYEWFWTGTMQDDVNSMRFVFHYYTPVDGAHSEMADLRFRKVPLRPTHQMPGKVGGTPTEYRHVFQVLVHRAKQGTDPVLEEKGAQIVAEMKAQMVAEGATLDPGKQAPR